MDDYKKFCIKCSWNDPDYGCICPWGEEVYQCPMYIYYHPQEVEEFNKQMIEWGDQMIMEFKPQVVKDSTMELCEEDTVIADIFATANPQDLFEEVLHLCMRRGAAIRTSIKILSK